MTSTDQPQSSSTAVASPPHDGGGDEVSPPQAPPAGGDGSRRAEGSLAAGDARGVFGDKLFSGLTLAAGITILVTLAFVALFLSVNSTGAVYDDEQGLVLQAFWDYACPLVIGTLIASLIALAVATPIAVGVALYISHYAPPRLSKPIGYVIDLLAAIPSVVYGAWGMTFLGPALVPVYAWLHENLGVIPLFAGDPSQTGRTI